MGFNTVAFILNDLLHEIKRSPIQVVWSLSHPPMGPNDQKRHRDMLADLAHENNEPILHSQALEVFPTFHADNIHYFQAGRNQLLSLEVLRYGKDKKTGRKTITLLLPE